MIVDLFAGGGGASTGIEQALDRPVDVAVNHDAAAIAMHAANHPHTEHRCESVLDVDPREACRGRPVDLLWASPDCTHFSRAKGGKPRRKNIRALAWVVVRWAQEVRPRVIVLENVPEFRTWGPLDAEGQVVPDRRGETFDEFTGALRAAGYSVEWRVLNAADYGAPTARRRLFLVARSGGEPIRWPRITHGSGLPYRTAAECIDWGLPIPSIFDRPRPLAEATERRIAEGIRRFVLMGRPFLVNLTHGARVEPVDEPLRTVTAAHRGEKALVAAFLAKHYTGAVGSALDLPLGTVTAVDHHSLVAAFLVKYYGSGGQIQQLGDPLHTITSKARFALATVTIEGEDWAIVDIGMRMLQPHELAAAQGFPADYVLTGTKSSQIARIGNSVCPPVAHAVVAAQLGGEHGARRAA